MGADVWEDVLAAVQAMEFPIRQKAAWRGKRRAPGRLGTHLRGHPLRIPLEMTGRWGRSVFAGAWWL